MTLEDCAYCNRPFTGQEDSDEEDDIGGKRVPIKCGYDITRFGRIYCSTCKNRDEPAPEQNAEQYSHYSHDDLAGRSENCSPEAQMDIPVTKWRPEDPRVRPPTFIQQMPTADDAQPVEATRAAPVPIRHDEAAAAAPLNSTTNCKETAKVQQNSVAADEVNTAKAIEDNKSGSDAEYEVSDDEHSEHEPDQPKRPSSSSTEAATPPRSKTKATANSSAEKGDESDETPPSPPPSPPALPSTPPPPPSPPASPATKNNTPAAVAAAEPEEEKALTPEQEKQLFGEESDSDEPPELAPYINETDSEGPPGLISVSDSSSTYSSDSSSDEDEEISPSQITAAVRTIEDLLKTD